MPETWQRLLDGPSPAQEEAAKLARLARRRAALDYIYTGLVLALLVGAGAALFVVLAHAQAELPDRPVSPVSRAVSCALAAGFVPLVIAWASRQSLLRLHEWLLDRLTPLWYFDVSLDLVRVVGAVPAKDWARVRRKMLALRPGLVPADDAPREHGCSMAAVPGSREQIRTQMLLRRAGALLR